MNTLPNSSNRIIVILIIVLIVVLLLLALTSPLWLSMMNGGMMMGGMMRGGNAQLVTGSIGERIFKTGINARGQVIQNNMMSGMGGCAMCHGVDGHGGQMMGRNVPCNTFKCLSAEGYSEDLIKRAITNGIAEDGHQLDLMMPRWHMSDSDLNDLIGYLKTLP